MNQIDLSLFAENNHKVPSKLLTTSLTSEQPFKVKDVIGSHILDGVLVLQLYVWVKVVSFVFFKSLMSTRLMDMAYNETEQFALNFSVLALVGWTYFATSYFFNQGQTPAMKLMKKRISISEHSFESSLKWSFYSLSVLLTCGLTAKVMHAALKEKGHGAMAQHDHFYQELMSYKTWAAPGLVDQTEAENSKNEQFEEAA